MNLSLRSKIQEDHLTCPICFMKFTKPKALPCLHTFCVGCLNDFVVGRNYDRDGAFPCPVCRKDIELPPQGVQGFPDNHIVASLLDTVEETPSPVPPPVPPRAFQPPGNTSNNAQENVPPPKPPRSDQGLSISQGADETQPQRLFGSGVHRQYIGKMVSDGIGSAMGVVTNISGYLNPQTKPSEPVQPPPMSPYELVDKINFSPDGQSTPANSQSMGDGHKTSSYPQLYPNLQSDSSSPCSQGLLLSLGKYGAGVNDFQKPYGLAGGKEGEIVVTDMAGNRVFVFSKTGELKFRFNLDCDVHGVAVTLDNNLLIAVSKSKSAIMRLYSMSGRLLQIIGDFYRYDLPSGIAVTHNNYVLLSNLAADNVLVFTDKRKSSVKFGWKGRGENHFTQPKFITSTSKDYIVVSDSGNDCIKVFDITGNFKRMFGKTGEGHGYLNHPLGVATEANDNIIIADSNNYRVEIYTTKGEFYTTFIEKTNLIGPDVKPINVCVTSDNNIAVLLQGTGFAEIRVYKKRSQSMGGGFHV